MRVDKIKKTLAIFKKLNKLLPSERLRYLQNISSKELESITELFANLLSEKLPISKLTILRLKPHAKLIRKLAKKITRSSTRKKLLKTARGTYILGLLIPAAINFLSGFL